MRITPATAAEVDAWLTALQAHGYLHHRETHPDGTWSVREQPDSMPWTLHHPVLAMDWIEALVREIDANEPDTRR